MEYPGARSDSLSNAYHMLTKKKMKRTDDYLSRTVGCATPYGLTAAEAGQMIDKANRKMKKL